MDQEVIYKALRGEATPDELEQVARWHSENPEDFQRCADEVHMQIDMMELYGEEIRPASWIAVHWRKVVRITVQAAAMLAIGLFVGGYISKERTYDMLAEQINTLQVPYGQRLKFTLPDGSSVQLNSGAKIEYPSVFKKNLRSAKLSGEALFDVSRDTRRPFVVETFACKVEVLGTRFNVNADERHDVFSTALMRGSVRVSSLADPQQQVVLKPHEKVQLSGGQLSLRTSDDPNEYLWAEGLISVSGRSFADILHRFEHCYGVRFDVKLDRMPDIEAMGKIRISDGIEHALRILQRSCSFHYAYDQETSTITIY